MPHPGWCDVLGASYEEMEDLVAELVMAGICYTTETSGLLTIATPEAYAEAVAEAKEYLQTHTLEEMKRDALEEMRKIMKL